MTLQIKTPTLGEIQQKSLRDPIRDAWNKIRIGDLIYLNKLNSSPDKNWKNFFLITSRDSFHDRQGRVRKKTDNKLTIGLPITGPDNEITVEYSNVTSILVR